MYKIMNLKKEVGIVIKTKETSTQLKPVRNTVQLTAKFSLACAIYACVVQF